MTSQLSSKIKFLLPHQNLTRESTWLSLAPEFLLFPLVTFIYGEV